MAAGNQGENGKMADLVIRPRTKIVLSQNPPSKEKIEVLRELYKPNKAIATIKRESPIRFISIVKTPE